MDMINTHEVIKQKLKSQSNMIWLSKKFIDAYNS